MNPLLAFYLGSIDDQGRFLKDILEWDDQEWERVHNYIQWVFPSVEVSSFNPDAPVLDQETIDIWKQSISLQNLLLLSTKRYLEFLERNTDIWCVKFDHNHLRITRMLKCLMILGLENQAKRIFNWLEDVAYQTMINQSSVEFWREAVEVSTYPSSSRPFDF